MPGSYAAADAQPDCAGLPRLRRVGGRSCRSPPTGWSLRPMVADDAAAVRGLPVRPRRRPLPGLAGARTRWRRRSSLIAEPGDAGRPGAPATGSRSPSTLDGALAGDVAVGLDADGLIATLGYTLAPAHQGRGLATEAVGAVVDRLFDDAGVHRIEAVARSRQRAVGAARRATSASSTRAPPVSAVRDGERWVDDVRYALTVDVPRGLGDHGRGTARTTSASSRSRRTTARAVLRLATHRSQQRFVAPMAESFADALSPEAVNGAPVVPWFRAHRGRRRAGRVRDAGRAHGRPPGGRTCGACSSTAATSAAGIGDRVIALLVDRLRAEGHRTLLVSWHPGAGGPEPFYLARAASSRPGARSTTRSRPASRCDARRRQPDHRHQRTSSMATR